MDNRRIRSTVLILLGVLLCTLQGPKLFAKEQYYIPLPININHADALTLSRVLDGVGEKKAAAIVVYRHQHGRFLSVEELISVKGIGRGTLDKNRSRITVD